jgi:hypothetical protein
VRAGPGIDRLPSTRKRERLRPLPQTGEAI